MKISQTWLPIYYPIWAKLCYQNLYACYMWNRMTFVETGKCITNHNHVHLVNWSNTIWRVVSTVTFYFHIKSAKHSLRLASNFLNFDAISFQLTSLGKEASQIKVVAESKVINELFAIIRDNYTCIHLPTFSSSLQPGAIRNLNKFNNSLLPKIISYDIFKWRTHLRKKICS